MAMTGVALAQGILIEKTVIINKGEYFEISVNSLMLY